MLLPVSSLRAWVCVRSASRLAATAGLLITVLGLGTAAAAARPVRSVETWKNGLIAFAENRPRLPPRVSVIHEDGSGKRALTRGHGPAFSPDGRKIAFVRGIHIFLFDLATGKITRVVGARGSSPSWSPDGRQ